jgi:succinate dehydrogenase/fumarate reductase flavoprotein subunit
MQKPSPPTEVDAVVVGSGAGGMSAAFVLAKSGLDVALLESTEYFGGTTAFAGGGVWIPNNHLMKTIGLADTRESAETYIRSLLGNLYDEQKVAAYLDTAPEMLKYLEDQGEVEMQPLPAADYERAHPGWGVGRTLLQKEYDGTRLGDYRRLLRPPLRELGVFHSMQVTVAEAMRMRDALRSPSAFVFTARLVARYLGDRLRYGRGAVLKNGNALAGRLLKSVLNVGVCPLNQAEVTELVISDGRVRGVVYVREGQEHRMYARRGVVLATGGFGANEALRRQHVPLAEHGYSMQPEGAKGDGIRLGLSAGGALPSDNLDNAIWVPGSAVVGPDGKLSRYPHFFFDRHYPGFIMVDVTGRRFCDEGETYQRFGRIFQQKRIAKCFIITDHVAVRKYGVGLVKPFPFSLREHLKSGYLIRANTIAALAAKLSVPGDTLEQTVSAFNANAVLGKDPEFGRGEDPHARGMGDPAHGPNPTLGPIQKAPFYAVEIRPSQFSTLIGLNTNASAQVLDDDGKVIAGLYAAGIDNNNFMRGHYPGGGTSLGPALTFGYIAGRHIARGTA